MFLPVCCPALQVVRLGFDRNKLVESIRTRQQNEASITYWLLLDNRRRMPSSGYLAHELSEAVAAANASFMGQPGGYPVQRGSHPGSVSGVGGDHQGLPQQRLLAERKWRLGLAVRGHPSALMAELYRVLQVGLWLVAWFGEGAGGRRRIHACMGGCFDSKCAAAVWVWV